MTSPLFPCQWQNQDKSICHRSAGSGGFCRRHLVAHRLALLWEPTRKENGDTSIAANIVLALFCALPFVFFHHAVNHIRFLFSHEAIGKEAGANPCYGLIFLAIGLVILSKAVALMRFWFAEDAPIESWAVVRFAYLWYMLSWVLGALWLIYWRDPASRVLGLLFWAPAVFVLTGVERRTGLASPYLAAAGLICLCTAGLLCPALEVVYHLTGRCDYLSTTAPQLRPAAARLLADIGIMYVVVAVEAFVALWFTGSPVTPFPTRDSHYRWSVIFREDQGWLALSLRACFYVVTLIIVLLGQAHLLRHAYVTLFGSYVLDVGPVIWTTQPHYVLAVVGCHYFMSRRFQQMHAQRDQDDSGPHRSGDP